MSKAIQKFWSRTGALSAAALLLTVGGVALSQAVLEDTQSKVHILQPANAAVMVVGETEEPGAAGVMAYEVQPIDGGLGAKARKPTCTGTCDGESRTCWGPRKVCIPFCNCEDVDGLLEEVLPIDP